MASNRWNKVVLIFFLCLAVSPYALAKAKAKAKAKLKAAQNVTENVSVAQEASVPEAKPEEKKEEFAGEFFGIKVPLSNYYFVKGALIVFGNRWGAPPETPEETEKCVWDQLLLSFEAFRRGIVVDDEASMVEIDKMLEANQVTFNRQKDQDSYVKWVKEKTGEPAEVFENQIRHLLQLEKLRQQVLESIKPMVMDEEAHEQFYRENSSLSPEIVEFDDKQKADEFYNKASRNKKFWEDEKAKEPKRFRYITPVSLAFLMDIWRIPESALYKMMKMSKGSIYPATPIYKGFGVFKVIGRKAASDVDYKKSKYNYYEKVRKRKEYEGFDNWFKGLREGANIIVYKTPITGGEEKK